MTSAIYFTSAAVAVNPPSTYCARSRVISPMRFFICASTSCSVYSAVSSPSSSFFVSTVSLIRYKPKYRKTLISKKVSRLPESTSNKTFRLISSFKLHLRPERVLSRHQLASLLYHRFFVSHILFCLFACGRLRACIGLKRTAAAPAVAMSVLQISPFGCPYCQTLSLFKTGFLMYNLNAT